MKVIVNIHSYKGEGRAAYYNHYKHFRQLVSHRIHNYPNKNQEKLSFRDAVLRDVYREVRFSLYRYAAGKLIYLPRKHGHQDRNISRMFGRIYYDHTESSLVEGDIKVQRSGHDDLYSGHIEFPNHEEIFRDLEEEYAELLRYPVGSSLGLSVTTDLPGKNPAKNSFMRPQASRELFGMDYCKTHKGTVYRFSPYGPIGGGEETVGMDPRQVRLRGMSPRMKRVCNRITMALRRMQKNNPDGFRRTFGSNLKQAQYNTVEFKTYASSRVKQTVDPSATFVSDGTSEHKDRRYGKNQQYTQANTQKRNTGVVTLSIGGPRKLRFRREISKGVYETVEFLNTHGSAFYLDPRDEMRADAWGHGVPPITNKCGASAAAVLRPNYATLEVHQDSSLQVVSPRVVEKLGEQYKDTNGTLLSRKEHFNKERAALKDFKSKHGSNLAASLRNEFRRYFPMDD